MKSLNLEKRTLILSGAILVALAISSLTSSMLAAILVMLVMLFDYDNVSLPRSKTTVGVLHVLATLSVIFQYLTNVPYKEVYVGVFILAIMGVVLYQEFAIKAYKSELN